MASPVRLDADQVPAGCADRPALELAPLPTEDIALIAKALAHKARLRIIGQFDGSKPRMAQEIVRSSPLAHSTTSEHLRILRDAGIVAARRDGARVWYYLCRSRLGRYTAAVRRLAALSDEP